MPATAVSEPDGTLRRASAMGMSYGVEVPRMLRMANAAASAPPSSPSPATMTMSPPDGGFPSPLAHTDTLAFVAAWPGVEVVVPPEVGAAWPGVEVVVPPEVGAAWPGVEVV